MRKQTITKIILAAVSISLTACSSGFFDKDNTPEPSPLAKFKPEIRPQLMWSVKTGTGSRDEYLKMSPSISGNTIFTAGTNGIVTATDKLTGRTLWTGGTGIAVLTGPGVGDGLAVVGSRRGDIVALNQDNGHIVWKANVPGEVVATPAVAQGHVIIKSVDGYVRSLSTQDGHQQWSFQQQEPNLILRGSSAPLIRDSSVVAGFANGSLGKFSLGNGQLYWMHPIAVPEGAFAIQRMIDVDADPIVFEHNIYAATYQGAISKLEWGTGRQLWTYDISSYTGMVADGGSVYVSDAKSRVWAFGANNGLVNWRQNELEARVVSGPAVMGNYVVVGDGEGYLHWLNKYDGRFAAREKVGSAIYAAPIVENNVLYALTNNGNLVAYKLR